MVKGTTSSGFEFSIPEHLDKDLRFIKAYRMMKSGDEDEQLDGALKLVSAVFADEAEEQRFYEYLAGSEGGRVPIDVVYREIGEIIRISAEEDKEIKNS